MFGSARTPDLTAPPSSGPGRLKTLACLRLCGQVAIEGDGALAHPTRDRVKIPYSRRLPTRGHLLAVVPAVLSVIRWWTRPSITPPPPPSSSCFSQASTSSHGMLTLDLVAEEDGALQEYDDDCDDSWENDLQMDGSCGQTDVVPSRQRADTDVSKLRVASKEPKVKTSSLPRGSERSWGKNSHLEAAKVHKKHQVQLELLPFFTLKLDGDQPDLIRFQLWGCRFSRLSLEPHNQERGSSRTLGAAVPPWTKCCPPGTPRPRGPVLSAPGSDQPCVQKVTGTQEVSVSSPPRSDLP